MTVVFLLTFAIVAFSSIHEAKYMYLFCIRTGDILLVSILITAIGQKHQAVHKYSLLILIFARVLVTIGQSYSLVHHVEPIDEYSDFFTTHDSIIRVAIPTSMVFVVRFKLFLLLVVPLTIISQFFVVSYSREFIQSSIDQCTESQFL